LYDVAQALEPIAPRFDPLPVVGGKTRAAESRGAADTSVCATSPAHAFPSHQEFRSPDTAG